MPPRSQLAGAAAWVPQTLQVRQPRKGETASRRTGKRQPYWELRWFVDGTELRQRFDRAGDAAAAGERLHDGYRSGWPFDPIGKRFVDPASLLPADEPDGPPVRAMRRSSRGPRPTGRRSGRRSSRARGPLSPAT